MTKISNLCHWLMAAIDPIITVVANLYNAVVAKATKIYRSPAYKVTQTCMILALAVFAFCRWRPIIVDAIPLVVSIPAWSIVLLFLSQLFMYFCNAVLFQLPLHHHYSIMSLIIAALQLNYVNTAIPYGEGLGFFWLQRLGKSPAARKELRYTFILRYAVTILTNNLLSLVAILWFRARGEVSSSICTAVVILNVALIAVFTIVMAIILLRYHRPPKGTILPFLFWGMIYSIVEDAPYWIIATGLGHPEFYPAIFVGTVAGDVIGELSPLPAGIGLHEVPMIVALTTLGADLNLATAFTLGGRALVLGLMLPIGFILAFRSSLLEGKHTILAAIENQQAISKHDTSPN